MITRFSSLSAANRYADACRERGEEVLVLDESVSSLRGSVPLGERVDDKALIDEMVNASGHPRVLRLLALIWAVVRAVVGGLVCLAIAFVGLVVFQSVVAILSEPALAVVLVLWGAVVCAAFYLAAHAGHRLGRAKPGLERVCKGLTVALCFGTFGVSSAAAWIPNDEHPYAVIQVH